MQLTQQAHRLPTSSTPLTSLSPTSLQWQIVFRIWQKSKAVSPQTSELHKKKWQKRPTRLQCDLAEIPVQERPVFPQQPPPTPRAERPTSTTQQWLRPRPEDEDLRQQMEQEEHLADQQAIAQWEEQMRQQTQFTPHPKLPQNPRPDNSE